MARPKSTAPNKQKLTLTVSAQSRLDLDFISRHTGQSISAMVEEWARKESRRIAKATGQDVPDVNQMAMDIETGGGEDAGH